MRKTKVVLGLPLVFTGLAVLAGECPSVAPMKIVHQGDPAPLTSANFETFDRPNLSASGHVAFTADTDAATDADDVVFVDGQLVAKEGRPAPGTKGGLYSAFEFFETGHQVNAAGDVVYIATLRDVPASENRAVYLGETLVALESEAAPGIPGRFFEDFGFAGLTDDGRVGYVADLAGDTGSDSVVYLDGAPLYREGAPVPGKMAIWDGNFDEVQWNGNGDLVVEGDTTLPGYGGKVVLRRLDADGVIVEEIVARAGQSIETGNGEDFLELILQTALADDGSWALRGNLDLAPSTENAVILTESGVLVQEGEGVPGMTGVTTGNFNAVDINSHGDLVYLADLEGTTPPSVDEAIFLNGCLLLTDGVQAPDQPEGVLITDIGFEDVWINDARQIVFAAGYSGAGVTGDGLYRIDLVATCPSDLDGDGQVGFQDLLAVLAAWGPCRCPEDLDGNGVVGFPDLLTVLAAWGRCP